MTLEIEGLERVTREEWADFCSDYRCVGTEPAPDILRMRHSMTNEVVGEVHYPTEDFYITSKHYFINRNVKGPRLNRQPLK
jgi:hypothetical protein